MNWKTIIEKNVNVPAIVDQSYDHLIKPALERLAAETGTPLDDLAVKFLGDRLVNEIIKEIQIQWEKLDGEA